MEVVIETLRLRLRRPRRSDLEAVLAYRSHPDVGRHLTAGVWTREKAERELPLYEQAVFAAPGDELVLLVERRDGSAVLGDVGLLRLEEPGSGEIGFVFDPRCSGQGFATEAVTGLAEAAFGSVGLQRLVAKTDEDNRASRAICERIGMRLLGTATGDDGRGIPECTYVLERPPRAQGD